MTPFSNAGLHNEETSNPWSRTSADRTFGFDEGASPLLRDTGYRMPDKTFAEREGLAYGKLPLRVVVNEALKSKLPTGQFILASIGLLPLEEGCTFEYQTSTFCFAPS